MILMLPTAFPRVVHVVGKLTGVSSFALLFLLWLVGVVELGPIVVLSRLRAVKESET